MKALVFLFYFIVLILMAAPGIAAAIFASFVLPEWTALLLLAAVNALVTLLGVFLCRNILSTVEFNI